MKTETKTKTKGAWIHRAAVRLLTLVWALLIFWSLGFLVEDIRSIRGPRYEVVEKKHVADDLVVKRQTFEKQIADLSHRIESHTEKQRLIGDVSRNLQQTISQLVELQKLSTEKGLPFSETDHENLTRSLQLFLDNQNKYQDVSQAVSALLEEKHKLLREKDQVDQEIEVFRQRARAEFDKLSEQHRLKLAFLQLAILLPLLLLAAVVILKKRSSIYFPLFLAFGAATLIKVTLVAHEYFPTRYFKYILIGGLLIVVGRLLIHFIRTIAFPKTPWLIKQYREAYERFLCPVCEYPIRIGPRRFLFWNRRTVNKVVVPAEHTVQEETYTCPSCGSSLLEECSACHRVRHAMLPYCWNCGAEKAMQ